MENSYILTINGGESSIKFSLFKSGEPFDQVFSGTVRRIGLVDSLLTTQFEEKEVEKKSIAVPDYQRAVSIVSDTVLGLIKKYRVIAVGHRIVHGGPNYYSPQQITPELLADLREIISLAPDHLPGNLLLVEELQTKISQAVHVACFDTQFHHDLPSVAKTIPLPNKYTASSLRKYGFHGLSCASIVRQLEQTQPELLTQKIVIAHLGSGASLTAVDNGKSIDTSMSVTPASGVPMSTRSGDLDPGIVTYLAKRENISIEQFDQLVNKESGLLGLSETSGDMQDLLNQEKQNPKAALAVDIFCYNIRKYIGSLAASLGGIDGLIFTGGIGEMSVVVRSRICDKLQLLGIVLDLEQNKRSATIISAASSRVRVMVLPSKEELMIASLTAEIVKNSN